MKWHHKLYTRQKGIRYEWTGNSEGQGNGVRDMYEIKKKIWLMELLRVKHLRVKRDAANGLWIEKRNKHNAE